jgi:Ser/Thr protein kinase RdoA (MazF antagonist)
MTSRFEALSEAQRIEHLADVAKRAVGHWDISADAAITLLNISENATYRVDEPGRGEPLVLRVHRTGYHTRNAVMTELAWMKALRNEAGIETPQAVAAVDGEFIQTVATPALDEERFVVMFEYIEGQEPDGESDLLPPFKRLGAIAAKMHVHARDWRRPEYFERLVWDYEGAIGRNANWGDWRDGMAMNAERIALFGQMAVIIKKRLQRFGKGPDRFGLAHADLRLANLLVTDDDTRVIDFDDAGLTWFLYDIATALSFMEDREDLDGLIAAWVEGYRTQAPLSAEEVAEIPTFLMLRRLGIVAWIGSHSQTDLARELGASFTDGTVGLARKYIDDFGF